MILRTTRLVLLATKTILQQTELIRRLDAESERLNDECNRLRDEKDAVEVAYMRISRDLMEQFLIALDQPEIQDDIRPRLVQSLGFYRDEIAVREEHA